MSCCYSYSNLFVYPGTRNTPKSEEADEEESVQVSCLKEPLRWTILLPLAGRAGTGHWNVWSWPKHLGELGEHFACPLSASPLFSCGGKLGHVGVTGVAEADDEHGDCGMGGGGQVSWKPNFLGNNLAPSVPFSWPRWLAGIWNSGSELRNAGVVCGDSWKLVSRLLLPLWWAPFSQTDDEVATAAAAADLIISGVPFISGVGIPAIRQCSSRAFLAMERITVFQQINGKKTKINQVDRRRVDPSHH